MTVDNYAVIGNPVSHSLSPQIHRVFAKETNQAMSYSTVEAELNRFVNSASEFFENGGAGLNVTVPFKFDAYRWVKNLDRYAQKAGAVNTIKFSNGISSGYNTDGIGLIRDLSRMNWEIDGKRILIVGAGGAAAGIIGPLVDAGSFITLTNRNLSKADQLAKSNPEVSVCAREATCQDWDIVINATSVGLRGNADIVPEGAIEGARCYDLIYRLGDRTPFIEWASDKALEVSDGLGMLIEQAAEAFFLWRSIRPTTTGLVETLRYT